MKNAAKNAKPRSICLGRSQKSFTASEIDGEKKNSMNSQLRIFHHGEDSGNGSMEINTQIFPHYLQWFIRKSVYEEISRE